MSRLRLLAINSKSSSLVSAGSCGTPWLDFGVDRAHVAPPFPHAVLEPEYLSDHIPGHLFGDNLHNPGLRLSPLYHRYCGHFPGLVTDCPLEQGSLNLLVGLALALF